MRQTKGQSLIEVVVAIGMMSLLLVALLALVSVSIKNSRLAKDRNLAVALANEGVELMRAYRDYSWTEFSSSLSSYGLPGNWVVEDSLSQSCDSSNYEINDYFARCVSLTGVEETEIDVTVTVYWLEGNKVHSTTQTTKFSKWGRE